MKFINFLNETPMIDHYSKDDIKDLVPDYDTFFKKNGTIQKVGFYHDYNLYKKTYMTGSYIYAIVDDENKNVIVCSVIGRTEEPSIGLKYFQQRLLWKDDKKDSKILDFLFNEIVDDNTMIASSDMQSLGGKYFWKRYCKAHIGSTHTEVGYIDKRPNITNRFVQFKSKDDFEEEFESQYKTYNVFYTKKK